MRSPPNHIMADWLASRLPLVGSISGADAMRMLFREFGVQGLRADAVIQIARLREQIAVTRGGATLSRGGSHVA